MVCEPTQFDGQRFIIRCHHPRIPASAKILGRVKAKTPNMPNSTTSLSVELGTNRLGGILDHQQSVLIRKVPEKIHVGTLSKQMHGNDGPRV